MINSKEYFYCPNGIMFSSQSGFKRIDCCLLATPRYIFTIPTKSVGTYLLFSTITTHQLFKNKSIDQGIRDIIESSSDIEDLEKSIISVLNNDEKYFTPIKGNLSFKFTGFFGKQTLRIGITRMKWISFSTYMKADSKLFRKFYEESLLIVP